jgi:hypothetical protein
MVSEKRLIKLQRILRESLQWGYDDVTDTEYVKCVETAEKMIAHGVTVQEWISVKDRLPEKEGTYIVHGNLGGVFGLFYDDMLSNSFKQMVTHWMPFPEPPKGE